MEFIFLLWRILFVCLIIGSGVAHLTATAAMAGYAESKGVGNAKLMTQISGVALVVGGLSVLLGIIAVMMHPFWEETDGQAKQTEMISFNKNIALAGGALAMYVLFYVTNGFGYFTITGALFN